MTPGWHADPTGRHQYRYWDGTGWTDDVADQGIASVDTLVGTLGDASGVAAGQPPPGRTPPAPAAGEGGAGTGDLPRVWPGQGPPPAVPPPGGGFPHVGGGPPEPALPPPGSTTASRRRPSPSVVFGLAAIAVAAITTVVVVVMSVRDDGETASDDSSATLGPDGFDPDAPASPDEIVDALAFQLEQSGMIDRQQAECFAGVLVDEVGEERLLEILSEGGDVLFELSGDEQSAIVSAISSCGIAQLPGPGTIPDDGG